MTDIKHNSSRKGQSNSTEGALAGLRVVDFSTSAAGPLVARWMADYGAEVVKIESKARPDAGRLTAPFKDNTPGLERAVMFLDHNTSKYGICLNLNNSHGADLAKRLVSWADIVVESFAPGTTDKWGLSYADIKKFKPDIIMVSSSLQGQTGRHARQPGWGYNLKGLAGFVKLVGWPDRLPVGTRNAYTDYIAPWFAIVAVLAAVDQRRRTGKGQHIDVSQYESSLVFLWPVLLDFILNGRVQTGMGNSSTVAAPHGAYRCLGDDRWCAISLPADDDWHAFCRVAGKPDWGEEPRFATIMGRLEHEIELNHLVEHWTIRHTAEEVMSKLQAAGLEAGIVQTCADIMERDPQLKHRGFWWLMQHKVIGPANIPRWAGRLSKTPEQIGLSPLMGEHTQWVCNHILGMSDDEFTRTQNDGAFG